MNDAENLLIALYRMRSSDRIDRPGIRRGAVARRLGWRAARLDAALVPLLRLGVVEAFRERPIERPNGGWVGASHSTAFYWPVNRNDEKRPPGAAEAAPDGRNG